MATMRVLCVLLLCLLQLQTSSGRDREERFGNDLLQDTFVEKDWAPFGEGVARWSRKDAGEILTLEMKTPSQIAGVSRIITLPQPLPAALLVVADVKLDGIKRGEKSWHSGRILLTYLDAENRALGESYTLDRMEGTSAWRMVRRQFPVAEGAVRARLELVLFHAAAGAIQFGNVSLRALNTEQAQAWRKEADERIERHRKASLQLRVEDADGRPVPGAEVSFFMQRHAYPFGTAVKGHFLTSASEEPEKKNYRSVIENFFNYATLEGELKDKSIAKNGLDPAVKALAWLQERGIKARGHVLVWPSFEQSSAAIIQAKDNPAQLEQLLRRRFKDVLTATAPFGLVDWDVANEPAVHKDLLNILGRDIMVEWFRWTKEGAPEARLYLNENNMLFGGGNQDDFEDWILTLQEAGAPIGGMGWQGHMWHKTLPAGQNALLDLDRFAPYGLKIQITEYDTDARFSEEESARFLDELLPAWFSHPSTDGFIMWGIKDDLVWNRNATLFRKDWSLKPAGEVWMNYLFKRWWTEVSGSTDTEGNFSARGFLGEYALEIRANGRRIRRQVKLGGDGLNMTVRLNGGEADVPGERLISSNPFTAGKLPQVIAAGGGGANLASHTIPAEAIAVVPASAGEIKGGAYRLEGAEEASIRRDLYLRFNLGSLKSGSVESAALEFTLAEPLERPAKVHLFALSPRFVPQGGEAGLDWQPGKMQAGYAPGRGVEDGEYRLGDAAVIYLGSCRFETSSAGSKLSCSVAGIDRMVAGSLGKTVTFILAPDAADDRVAILPGAQDPANLSELRIRLGP